MAKEVLLYDSIYSFSAERFVKDIQEVESEGGSLVVRINTPGGSVQYGYPMIAKFKEFTGSKIVKIDGQASSMGAYFLCYVDDVEALDVSEFVLHRAAYPDWLERDSSFMNETRRASLIKMNKDLRDALESKIDVAEFEKITKVTLDDMFSLDNRIDVPLNALQAKKIGLINKIVKLSSDRKEKMTAYYSEVAAEVIPSFLAEVKQPKPTPKQPSNQIITNNMDLAKLKAENPALYDQVVAIGVAKENDRVCSFLAFQKVDAEAVKKHIVENDEMTQTITAEFTVKMTEKGILANLTDGSQGDLTQKGEGKKGDPETPEAIALAEANKFNKEVEKYSKEYSE